MLSAVGWPLDLLISRALPHARSGPQIAAALGSACLAFAIIGARARMTTRLASLAFLVNSAIVALALWFSNAQYATYAASWVPFQANKLGVLTVGLLTPERWVGLLSIAAYTVTALLQWYGFTPEVRERAAVGEPLAMLAYALFGTGLLLQTTHRFRAERELALAQQRAAAFQQLARTLLAIRDYANTPLQTLVMVTEQLSAEHPELARELGLQMRALARLRRLNALLSAHDARMAWAPGDESFDPERELARIAAVLAAGDQRARSP